MQKAKNNIEKVVESTIKNLGGAIDVNKIVGLPIKNGKGQTVIPISKMTVGLISGGGEYGDVKIAKELGNHFAGGTATVCSIKPSCFLIDNGAGFSVINESSDGVEMFLKAIAKFLGKIKI